MPDVPAFERTRRADDRIRRQAARLEALCRVVTEAGADALTSIEAKLREARTALRYDQPFGAILSRVDGAEFVVIALSDPFEEVGPLRSIAPGRRFRIEGGLMAPDKVSRYSDDLAAGEEVPSAFIGMGIRAIIATKFAVAGDRYALTLVSPEPTRVPFSAEDVTYVEVLGASIAKQIECDQLADSLRAEKDRSLQHANRLEGLLKIVNDGSLGEASMWLAMLEHAVRTIIPGQPFRGILSRVDGDFLVQTAVVEAPLADGTVVTSAAKSVRPLAGLVAGYLVTSGGKTQMWDDIEAVPHLAFASSLRWKSAIVTTFSAGGALWTLTFLSRERTRRPFDDADSSFIELLASFFANHAQQQWQFERLRYQQEHDALTGLLNRSHFRTRARIAATERTAFAIVMLGLSDFRDINEAYGYMTGDAMLVEVGSALRRVALEGEVVGRVGGDVFGVFLPGALSIDAVRARILAISEIFAQPFSTGDRDGKESIALTASIGVAIAPYDGNSFDEIMSHADAALAAIKRSGQGALLFYEPGMEGDAQFNATLRTEIATALAEDQFELFFQPHVNLQNGAVVGCEALIRWHHPLRGLVPPGSFIPFAERSGIIASIDAWVMRKSFAAAAEMSSLQPDFRLYFNLSGRQAGSPDLVNAFAAAAATGVRMANIGVEITESDAMRNVDDTRRVCEGLHKLGVRIAMDDFGTGYSSLAALKRLPIDTVKIDRSFVSGVLDDPHDIAIAESIIAISKHFGFESVAEGAETAEQIDWLRGASCGHAQGFGICHPVPMAEFKSWFAGYVPSGEAGMRSQTSSVAHKESPG